MRVFGSPGPAPQRRRHGDHRRPRAGARKYSPAAGNRTRRLAPAAAGPTEPPPPPRISRPAWRAAAGRSSVPGLKTGGLRACHAADWGSELRVRLGVARRSRPGRGPSGPRARGPRLPSPWALGGPRPSRTAVATRAGRSRTRKPPEPSPGALWLGSRSRAWGVHAAVHGGMAGYAAPGRGRGLGDTCDSGVQARPPGPGRQAGPPPTAPARRRAAATELAATQAGNLSRRAHGTRPECQPEGSQ